MILRRADGKERIVMGYKPSTPKKGVKKYSTTRFSDKQLPSKVDLRPKMTTIEYQGQTNSCVANAVAGAYEYLALQHLDEPYDVSRLFIYYNARLVSSDEIEDSGSYIQDAIESLKEYGACSEETWQFDEDYVNEEPSEEAYEEAANFLLESVELVPVELHAWKHALAEGNPIIFGISLYASFDKHKKRGFVPMPTKNESERGSHAGHAMLCVGYSDKDKVFIVRNSWGEDWGENGYCYIPYDYLINKKYNDGDCWIIKQLDNFEIDEETWAEDDEYDTILEDLETEISNLTDEEYEDLLDAMGEYPLEFRITLIMLYAAYTDEEFTDEEYEEIAAYLETTLETVSTSDWDYEEMMNLAYEEMENEELVYESIDLLGEYLSNEVLAKIVNDIFEVIAVDDLADEEADFLNELMEHWQIDPKTVGDFEEE